MDSQLTDDVWDRIMQCLPDFITLRATALVSKRFYAIYSEHPMTINRRVAWNVAGPALPQAIRLIRHEVPSEDEDVNDDEDEDDRRGPPDVNVYSSVETTEGPPLTVAEQNKLSVYADCASKLEVIFSYRFKDRSSRKRSSLNSLESERLRRALFRLSLYAKIFNLSRYSPTRFDFADDSEIADNIARETDFRKSFLVDFYAEELVELYAASNFLQDLVSWTSYCSSGSIAEPHFLNIALAAGPEAILAAYETGTLDAITDKAEEQIDSDFFDMEEGFLEGYLTCALNSIWERRKVTPPKVPTELDNNLWHSILETVQEHDICVICNQPRGLSVWNEYNWEDLRGLPQFHHPGQLMLGNLRRTTHFISRLQDECNSLAPRLWPTLINELFDLKSADYDAWQNVYDPLCTDCLHNFISSHLHIWLLAKMHAKGSPVQEDCWYGYNCRTQVHNHAHCIKLNHLCAPTR